MPRRAPEQARPPPLPSSTVSLPVPRPQILLPGIGRTDDLLEVVVGRLPAEHRAHLLGAGDDRRRVARPPRRLARREIDTRNLPDHIDNLPNAVAGAIAAIHGRALAARAQIGEQQRMRLDEVGYVDVVAHAGAVRGRVVGAEDVDMIALA